MPIDLQAKLLRVLESGEFLKIGETKPRKVDMRVIAATNRDLPEEIRTGNFREDLYHRIGVVVVRVPALREHAQDIPLLVDHFIRTICAEYHIPAKRIEDEALAELDKYLDDAYLAHLPSVRVVHGKGTGALRSAVQNHLKRIKCVKSYRLGGYGEGDAGVTIVTFKE